MSIKRFTVITLLAAVCLAGSVTDAGGQTRKSRKVLIKENEELRNTLDSLRRILSESIALSDTTSVEDTVNGAGIGFMDDALYNNVSLSGNPDSLLSVWYLQRQIGNTMEGTAVDFETVNFTSDIPDEVYIENIKKMNSYIPIPYNSIIKNYIIFYTQKIPHKSATILGLSSYYLPIFEEIFDSYNMPRELAAVAIIESALNPFAVSRVKAKGMWQFMYTTAKQYDLEVNSYVDERLDPIKSCHAAAQYLKDAYTIFGDWALAISSYNCGSGNVNKAIRRSGGRDFWTIYPYLPRETRGYVPSFVGALYLLHYYKNYNIVPEKVCMPAHVDTFKVHKNLHFEQISHNIGIDIDQLRLLNPQYTRDIIPASDKGYVLQLPYNYTVPFVENEREIYAYKDSIYFPSHIVNSVKGASAAASEQRIVHSVKSGQTLGGIAARYGVTVAQLKKWNGIKKENSIRIGQKIVIYKNGGAPSYSSNTSSSSAKGGKTSGTQYKTYTIRKGDTLYMIARKHNMTLNDLMKINGLTKSSKILPGKKLKVKS